MSNDSLFIIGISISSAFMLVFLCLWMFWVIKKRKNNSYIKKLGKQTEENVTKKLQFWAHKNNVEYFPPSIFKYEKNKIFEVDGILLTPRAIIVVEVKNIKGDINGQGNEKIWYKTVNNNVFEIKSPILQNDKHIEHIIKMTKIKVPIISLIVFDESSINKLNIENVPSHVLITKTNELDSSLDLINKNLLPKINSNELNNILYLLEKFKTNSKKDKQILISYSKEYNEKSANL